LGLGGRRFTCCATVVAVLVGAGCRLQVLQSDMGGAKQHAKRCNRGVPPVGVSSTGGGRGGRSRGALEVAVVDEDMDADGDDSVVVDPLLFWESLLLLVVVLLLLMFQQIVMITQDSRYVQRFAFTWCVCKTAQVRRRRIRQEVGIDRTEYERMNSHTQD
jgi:hypothetical protein